MSTFSSKLKKRNDEIANNSPKPTKMPEVTGSNTLIEISTPTQSNGTTSLGAGFANVLSNDPQLDNMIRKVPTENLFPAPDGWNFFRPLSPLKKQELITTIEKHGLINPITVWQENIGDDEYMILSGHNRVTAYETLYEMTKDPQYLNIPCIVKSGISKEDAKQIIIICNYVSRDLTTMERTKSIMLLYKQYKGRHKGGFKKVAELLNAAEDTVYEYAKLNNLIEELADAIDKGILTIKLGVRLSRLSKNLQMWLFTTYKDYFNTKKKKALHSACKQIKAKDTEKEIQSYFKELELGTNKKKCQIDIPVEYHAEFETLIQQWLETKGLSDLTALKSK